MDYLTSLHSLIDKLVDDLVHRGAATAAQVADRHKDEPRELVFAALWIAAHYKRIVKVRGQTGGRGLGWLWAVPVAEEDPIE